MQPPAGQESRAAPTPSPRGTGSASSRTGSYGACSAISRREVPRRLQPPKRRTIGVRVPDHAVVRALLDALGEPILSTTLSLPGDDAPMNDPRVIHERLGSRLDAVVDAGACAAEPTTVVDLAGDVPVVTRIGRGDPARLGLSIE